MIDADIKLESIITLSSEERRRLVDLLWWCNNMSRREARNVVVDDLPDEIRKAIKRDLQNDKLDIRLIVQTCQDYLGGLVKLIEIVRFYENNSLQMQAVDEFMQQLQAYQSKLRKEEHDKRLEELIADIDLTGINLDKLYIASLPKDPTAIKWSPVKGSSKIKTLFLIVAKLADAPFVAGDLPPILKFVEYLASQSSKKSDSLKEWVDAVAHSWRVSARTVAEFRQKICENTAYLPDIVDLSPAYLLIMLEPEDAHSAVSFYVKAWLFYGQEEIECLHLSRNGELYTSSTMPEFLDNLLLKIACNKKIAPTVQANLRIEFFLPRLLFLHQVDSWLIDENTIPIGIRNQVVVRSSERIKDSRNRSFWQDKWERACKLSTPIDTKYIHWLYNFAECNGMKVYTKPRAAKLP